MKVFPEEIKKYEYNNPDEALNVIGEYQKYMKERVEFAIDAVSRIAERDGGQILLTAEQYARAARAAVEAELNNETTRLDGEIYNTVADAIVEYYKSYSYERLEGGTWEETDEPYEYGKFTWSRTKYISKGGTVTYSEPACISGLDGESSLTVEIVSSNGNIFKSNEIYSTLECKVFYGTEDVTDRVTRFIWKKIKSDGNVDPGWGREMSGSVITITPDDVFSKAQFVCTVEINL